MELWRVLPTSRSTFNFPLFLTQTKPLQTEVSATPLYALHDEIVFPAPTTYTPMRWLVRKDQKREMLAYYHPFSRGRRQCVGQK
jgi:cytochrome P450